MTAAFVDLAKDSTQLSSINYSDPLPPQDANGNVLGDFNMVTYDDLLPGDYTISFTGAPNAALNFSAVAPDGSQATTTLKSKTTQGGMTTAILTMSALPNGKDPKQLTIGFRNTGGLLKNLSVIRPGYPTTNPPLFTNEFLGHFKNLGPVAIRYMAAMQINSTLVANWSERTSPANAFPNASTLTKTVPFYTGPNSVNTLTGPTGVPIEYLIAMSNTLNADMWITIPSQATDDYVTQLAKLIKNGDTVNGVTYAALNPNLHVYVEYSNEVWNFGFNQWYMNMQAAINEVSAGGSNLNYDGDTNTVDWGSRRVAERSIQIGNDFAAVYGKNAMNNQIRVIMPEQVGNAPGAEDKFEYVQANYGPPMNYFYALAGTDYSGLTQDQMDASCLTVDQMVADYLSDLSDPGVDNILQTQANVTNAHAWGLPGGFVAYEASVVVGGSALGSGVQQSDCQLANNAATELDPRFANIVQQQMSLWYANGGGLYNYSSLGMTYGPFGSKYGDWDITDDIYNETEPKELGYIATRTEAFPALNPVFPVTLPGELDARDWAGRLYVGINPSPLLNAGDLYVFTSTPAYIDYSILAPTNGTYQLVVTTAPGSSSAAMGVMVNGTQAGTATTPNNPAGIGTTNPVRVTLNAGFNAVRLNIPTSVALHSLRFLDANGDALPATTPNTSLYTLPGLTIAKSTTSAICFGLADSATAANKLQVTAVSDNPTLIPNDAAHLSFTFASCLLNVAGSGNEQLRITPTPGQTGTANVTVTVANAAGLSTSTIVAVTVK
jgi:hypothetical protein